MVSLSNPRTVVVIDDEVPIGDAVSRFLGMSGWHVLVCYDPARGLDAVIADPPFALLVDLKMPSMHGGTLVRRVREALGPDSPRIVIISAHQPTHEDAALVDGVLRKPFRPSELENLLAGWAEEDPPAVDRSGTRRRPGHAAPAEPKKKKNG